uniref:Ubiquitin carboxyl-terminal hydrolase n=1 Tax=Heterorhabditis bacteriophora TaxID=37862 RepID=A0A1I7XJ80_HETBA
MGKFEWQALESNPDTINQFLAKIGVESVECVDVFSFDGDSLSFVPTPQLAMLLCFPNYEKVCIILKLSVLVDAIMAPIYDKMKLECATPPTDIFFMKQKISNACGTFALFHALANLEGVIDLG